MSNVWEIVLTPDDFIPPASNHADQGVIQQRRYMAFDAATVENMISKALQMPANYAGGVVKVDVLYAMASATSGNVDFEASVEAITPADAVDTDSASSFDTANGANQTVPGTAGYLGKLSISLTNKDGVAAGDMFRIKLERDADDGTNDTATGDARVYAVTVYEEA